MATRTLPSMPGLAGLYARALGGLVPSGGHALAGPDAKAPPTLRVEGVRVDARHLEAYRQVCGFQDRDQVPATYPQTVAFPLVLALLTAPGFPVAALGTIHIGNRIAHDRPLSASDVLDYEVAAGEARPHPRGTAVTLSLGAASSGQPVWHADMELLRRGPSATSEPVDEMAVDVPGDPPPGPQAWRLRGDLGRRYARVSGDRNPIHLADLAAKPFGFSRHIAHGMWTHARALAELENRLAESYTVEVAFKRPVLLPSTVYFGARVMPGADEHIDFGLASRPQDSTGAPATHLLGRIRPL